MLWHHSGSAGSRTTRLQPVEPSGDLMPNRVRNPRRRELQLIVGCVIAAALLTAHRVEARDELCDSAYQNCRTPLLALINSENVEIDVGMWFMEDARYSSALINRMNAGVQVRI